MWQIYERKEYALTRGGLIDELVVTTNYEKSAEVIVGGNAEGPNNLKAQAKCMLHNKSDRESRRNVNELKISLLRKKLCKRKGASAHMEDKIISQILNPENMHKSQSKSNL